MGPTQGPQRSPKDSDVFPTTFKDSQSFPMLLKMVTNPYPQAPPGGAQERAGAARSAQQPLPTAPTSAQERARATAPARTRCM